MHGNRLEWNWQQWCLVDSLLRCGLLASSLQHPSLSHLLTAFNIGATSLDRLVTVIVGLGLAMIEVGIWIDHRDSGMEGVQSGGHLRLVSGRAVYCSVSDSVGYFLEGKLQIVPKRWAGESGRGRGESIVVANDEQRLKKNSTAVYITQVYHCAISVASVAHRIVGAFKCCVEWLGLPKIGY